jgi:hypothetical protein
MARLFGRGIQALLLLLGPQACHDGPAQGLSGLLLCAAAQA